MNAGESRSLFYYVLIAFLCFAVELALSDRWAEIQPIPLPSQFVLRTANPCPLGQIYRVINNMLQCSEPPGTSSTQLHYLTLTSSGSLPILPSQKRPPVILINAPNQHLAFAR
jgi:hypothetical protein